MNSSVIKIIRTRPKERHVTLATSDVSVAIVVSYTTNGLMFCKAVSVVLILCVLFDGNRRDFPFRLLLMVIVVKMSLSRAILECNNGRVKNVI